MSPRTAALKQMAALFSQTIEAGGKRRLQPMYPRYKIPLGRLHRQVVVIAHDHVSWLRESDHLAAVWQSEHWLAELANSGPV